MKVNNKIQTTDNKKKTIIDRIIVDKVMTIGKLIILIQIIIIGQITTITGKTTTITDQITTIIDQTTTISDKTTIIGQTIIIHTLKEIISTTTIVTITRIEITAIEIYDRFITYMVLETTETSYPRIPSQNHLAFTNYPKMTQILSLQNTKIKI